VAPVLLCPECGTKHPLDGVSSSASFPCSGCGRTLKVPAQAREMAASSTGPSPVVAAVPPAPREPVAPAPHPTQTVSAVPPVGAPVAAAAAVSSAPPLGAPQGTPPADVAAERAKPAPAPSPIASAVPPAWMRFLIWLIAVPLAFLIVFGLARAFGFLATNDITDIALAEGFHRYWPIVRLLPFVALLTALFVTGGVYAIARLRADRQRNGSSGRSPKPGATPGPKTRRPPAQSSRAGA
jgi:hypothetical protein